MLRAEIACGFRHARPHALVFHQIVVHLEPGKPAFIVHMEGRFEIQRIHQGGAVNVYLSLTTVCFISHGRATVLTEMPVHTLGAFECFRCFAGPFEVLDRHSNPGDHGCSTVSATIFAMTVAGPGRVAVVLPPRLSAEAMSARCHVFHRFHPWCSGHAEPRTLSRADYTVFSKTCSRPVAAEMRLIAYARTGPMDHAARATSALLTNVMNHPGSGRMMEACCGARR